jgi:hypothetical protein
MLIYLIRMNVKKEGIPLQDSKLSPKGPTYVYEHDPKPKSVAVKKKV